MEIRANIKKYFDIASSGDIIIVPRKGNMNVVIMSEAEYIRMSQTNRLEAYAEAMIAHSARENVNVSLPGNIKTENHEKLKIIENLKDGWNGHGAPAFSGKLMDKARKLIDELLIQPEIFPTTTGKMRLEYENSRHDHMDIMIDSGNKAEIFTETYEGKEFHEIIPSTSKAINEKVRTFYR